MIIKRFIPAAMAMFAFFCSGFVSESYLNRALAESAESEITASAKNKVKSIYPEFINLVKNGVDKEKMTQFAEKNVDKAGVSKEFCGEQNDELFTCISEFLIWRLETEALQSVRDYKLQDDMQAIDKGSSVYVKCKLKSRSDTVNMTVIFSKSGTSIGGIREIVILEIPLIKGAKIPMKKYFEENGIKINELKPAKRAEKGCLALKKFIKENSKK